MKNFRPYLNYLDKLVDEAIRLPLSTASLDAALDGQPADELRRLVSLDQMRSTGAFFTGSKLSKIALQKFVKSLDEQSIILDPACGAGDLLIACAMHLPKGRTLKSTLQIWGDRIMGRDLHPEFIRATKNRLVLAAIREVVSINDHTVSSLEPLFPRIEERNGLSDYDAIRAASHIVINPPFTMVEAPENCSWASGKINAAALFLEACIEQANNGTRIMAILPDVLRSGSRYRKWREVIERRARQLRLQLCRARAGAFIDQWSVTCAGGLVGETIVIEGLSATLTDVLVRLERADGTIQIARLTPDTPNFVVEAIPSAWSVTGTYLTLGVEHILLVPP